MLNYILHSKNRFVYSNTFKGNAYQVYQKQSAVSEKKSPPKYENEMQGMNSSCHQYGENGVSTTHTWNEQICATNIYNSKTKKLRMTSSQILKSKVLSRLN